MPRAVQYTPNRRSDGFFTELTEKVLSVEDTGARHPLSARVAVATLKRLLPNPQEHIRLQDLVSGEVEALWKELASDRFVSAVATPPPKEIRNRLIRYEALTDVLLRMLCAGVTFGKESLDPIWLGAIKRIGTTPPDKTAGYECLTDLKGYPAVLLLYATGLAALTNRRLELMFRVMLMPVRDENAERFMVRRAPIGKPDLFWLLPERGSDRVPLSNQLHGALREPLRPLFPDDEEYERMFDRFEYLLSIVAFSVSKFIPGGRFVWRRPPYGWKVYEELSDMTPYWVAAMGSLPTGSTEFSEAAKQVLASIEKAKASS